MLSDTTVSILEAYENRDNEEILRGITSLSFGLYPVSSKKKQWFSDNDFEFVNLKRLDLSHQNIGDDYAEELFLGDFARLEEINLSFNPRITSKTLDEILSSDTLGGRRSAVSINGRYEQVQSVVNVIIGGNGIRSREIEDYKENGLRRFGFKILIDKKVGCLGMKSLNIVDAQICPTCRRMY